MAITGLIVTTVAIGSAYFFYRYGKKTLPTEEIEELAINDVAAFFKSKGLRKGIDVPFVATKEFFVNERSLARMIPYAKPAYETVVLGVMDKETNGTTLYKAIFTKTVDPTIAQTLKEKGLVVLG